MIYTELLKNAWNSLYDPQAEVIKTVEKFFHQEGDLADVDMKCS